MRTEAIGNGAFGRDEIEAIKADGLFAGGWTNGSNNSAGKEAEMLYWNREILDADQPPIGGSILHGVKARGHSSSGLEKFKGVPVLIVSEMFSPIPVGSAPYVTELADGLDARGCDVAVLTSSPRYPNPDAVMSTEEDKLRPDVAIRRIDVRRSKRRRVLDRLVSEATFFAKSLMSIALRRDLRRPTVMAVTPTSLTVPIARFAAGRKGRVVAIVHDVQSGLARNLSVRAGGRSERIFRFAERLFLNMADELVVLTPEMATALKALGVRKPIHVRELWVDTRTVKPSQTEPHPPTVLYSGTLGHKQGVEALVDLAEDLQARMPDARVVIRGEGPSRAMIEERIREQRLRNVQLETFVPADRLSESLADGDVHLVPQLPSGADFAMPSKIYSSLGVARPFVATADSGTTLARFCKRTGAGVCVPPGNRARLAEEVARLLGDADRRNEMGWRGRAYVEERAERSTAMDWHYSLILGDRAGDARPSR